MWAIAERAAMKGEEVDGKKVLYVLLAKPGNDPSVVGERREIALRICHSRLRLRSRLMLWSSLRLR